MADDIPVPLDDTLIVRESLLALANATEVTAADGGPLVRLFLRQAPQVQAGWMQLWDTPDGHVIDRVFHIWMGGQGNDMNLMYAMTRADSPVPHFLMHYNVNPGEIWSYHIDIVPKVDGVMYPDYWRTAMSPLSKVTESKIIKALPIRRIQADRKQYLSTWGMYGKEVSREEYEFIRDEVMPQYVAHFTELVGSYTFDEIARNELIERSRKQMDMLFDREMDLKGWGRLEALFGREAGDRLREACRAERQPVAQGLQ